MVFTCSKKGDDGDGCVLTTGRTMTREDFCWNGLSNTLRLLSHLGLVVLQNAAHTNVDVDPQAPPPPRWKFVGESKMKGKTFHPPQYITSIDTAQRRTPTLPHFSQLQVSVKMSCIHSPTRFPPSPTTTKPSHQPPNPT